MSSPAGVLGAMSVSKPVVAMRWGESAEQSQAAAFVAGPDAQPGQGGLETVCDGRAHAAWRVVGEDAIDRQGEMPQVADPESLPDLMTAVEELKRKADDHCPGAYCIRNPIELRTEVARPTTA